tara:strand:+ start:2257 stop:3306 length:1050 start_codon:yes stop_codon:yes gene_type:complete
MNSIKLIIFILVIFLKTGNVLSETSLFNVNNVEIISDLSRSNQNLANQAIKKGFKELINKVLLEKDLVKLENLKFNQIKSLVSYYQISESVENRKEQNIKKIYNIFFDKGKVHDLFYRFEISYSDISQYEIYFLPVHKKEDELYIYNQNYFYIKWNEVTQNELIEYIFPLEKIEILQSINNYKDNLINIDIRNIFQEYSKKNYALVIIEENKLGANKIFLKTNIMGKNVNKSIVLEKKYSNKNEFYEDIIYKTNKQIINLVKSQNLIDIRTPSFINIRFLLDKKNNLVELDNRLKKIDLIENLYVQEFNKQYVLLKIKYLGKINKIIDQLKNQNILLEIKNDQWSLKII